MRKTIATLGIATACLLGPAAAAEAGTGPDVTCAKASVTFTQTGIASFPSSTSGDACTVQLSSWSVPDTYDGKGYDASAKPQTLFDRTTATLTGETSTVSVKIPASRWCQIDYRAAGGKYLYGRIVECHALATVTPKPPIVTPPKHVRRVVTVTHHTPTRIPAQLAFTASPFDLSKYAEGGAAALLLGVAIFLAAGFRQSGPTHRSFR